MASDNRHMPPKADDEIYLGNTRKDRQYKSPEFDLEANGMKTIRYAEGAMDSDGNPLPEHVAVFINRSEEMLYDKIMTIATFGQRHWDNHQRHMWNPDGTLKGRPR